VDVAQPATSDIALTVDAGASAIFTSSMHLGALTVNGNASVTRGGRKTIVTKSLAVAGRLDLGDNNLLIDYTGASPIGAWNGSAYTGVTGLLAEGFDGGIWAGSGIVTSATDARNSLTTLGVAEASDVFGLAGSETVSWNGQVIDATCVLVKYTYAGDANLGGDINADDYANITYNGGKPNTFGFYNGDINYDGAINGDDLLVETVQQQRARLLARIPITPTAIEGFTQVVARKPTTVAKALLRELQ
jgi:hypothetical protein